MVLLPAVVAAVAQQPAGGPAPSTSPSGRDPRAKLAVVGLLPETGGDPRDGWLAVAFEELLTRRLRRMPAVIAIPTIRLHQGRQELQEPDTEPVPWPRVARGLGATHLLGGSCSGPASAVTLELTLSRVGKPEGTPEHVRLPAGRLFDVLDQATSWVLDRLNVPELDQSVSKQVFAQPSRSPTAVEYYARATSAIRAGKLRDALRYAGDSVASDKHFRPATGLLAQLELQLGASGRESASRRLRILSELARRDGDVPDRANAELTLSLLLQANGASEAAHTRAQTALSLAVEQRDVYAQVAALSWLTDLCVTWQPPAGTKFTVEERHRFEQDNLKRAAEWQRALIDVLHGLGDVIAELPAASKLALIYERLEQPEAALEMHRRTLELAVALGSRRHQATAWLYLGQWYRTHERWPEAVAAMNSCLEVADEKSKAQVRVALGGVYQAMNDPGRALVQFEQACGQLRNANDLVNQFVCLREIARLKKQLGRTAEAIPALQEAVDIAHALKLSEEQALHDELARWKSEKP
ncbi:MAG: tetratricopeptide repeat protein [Phycisphaerae bacterium]|nr:tetratricopeptide repeat protein [Phycisphaerae bacterium]